MIRPGHVLFGMYALGCESIQSDGGSFASTIDIVRTTSVALHMPYSTSYRIGRSLASRSIARSRINLLTVSTGAAAV